MVSIVTHGHGEKAENKTPGPKNHGDGDHVDHEKMGHEIQDSFTYAKPDRLKQVALKSSRLLMVSY